MSSSTTTSHGGDDPLYDDDRGPRRLRLGVLAALGIAVVVIGVVALGPGGEAGAPATTAALPGDPPRGGEGAPAPDFEVALFDGSAFRLSDHLRTDGRPVFLNLWASWCPPCRAEMPDLSRAAEAHPDVMFLGIAVEDDAAAARAFAESISVSYAVGADLDGSVDRAFPAPGLPATYLIDEDGTVVRVVYGQVTAAQIEGMLADHFG